MTIEEKSKKIKEFCKKQVDCEHCVLKGHSRLTCYSHWGEDSERQIEANYEFLFVSTPDSDANPVNDPVNHPSHYTKGKIEVADFIADQKLNFDRGNAVKYVCRAGSKDPDKEIQDLEKAIWYINHEIKTLKGDINNGTEKET